MTTDSDGSHVNNFFYRKVLYHFSLSKVIPKKTKFNTKYLLFYINNGGSQKSLRVDSSSSTFYRAGRTFTCILLNNLHRIISWHRPIIDNPLQIRLTEMLAREAPRLRLAASLHWLAFLSVRFAIFFSWWCDICSNLCRPTEKGKFFSHSIMNICCRSVKREITPNII